MRLYFIIMNTITASKTPTGHLAKKMLVRNSKFFDTTQRNTLLGLINSNKIDEFLTLLLLGTTRGRLSVFDSNETFYSRYP